MGRAINADAGAPIDTVLTALAEPKRRRVVEALSTQPHTAGELSQVVGLSPQALSRHLRQLRRCGLVFERHPEFDARVRIYHLDPTPMQTLKDWLADAEAAWAEQLAAFKAFAEASVDSEQE